MTLPEVGEARSISPRTAERLWAYARSWLRQEPELGRIRLRAQPKPPTWLPSLCKGYGFRNRKNLVELPAGIVTGLPVGQANAVHGFPPL